MILAVFLQIDLVDWGLVNLIELYELDNFIYDLILIEIYSTLFGQVLQFQFEKIDIFLGIFIEFHFRSRA